MKTELTKSELQTLQWGVLLLWCVPWSIFAAFVLTKVWLWFIVPLGLPPIGLAHAYALGLMISWLTQKAERSETTLDDVIFQFLSAPLRPGLVFLVSLILKGAM